MGKPRTKVVIGPKHSKQERERIKAARSSSDRIAALESEVAFLRAELDKKKDK